MRKPLKLSDEQLQKISASVLASVKSKAIVTPTEGEALRKATNESSQSSDKSNTGATIITKKNATKIFDNAFKKAVSK